jgi:hypothetical protein
MCVFFTAILAVTCDHNLTAEQAVGSLIIIHSGKANQIHLLPLSSISLSTSISSTDKIYVFSPSIWIARNLHNVRQIETISRCDQSWSVIRFCILT